MESSKDILEQIMKEGENVGGAQDNRRRSAKLKYSSNNDVFDGRKSMTDEQWAKHWALLNRPLI